MRPGHGPRVLINEEAQLIAEVRVTRAVAEGEPITTADVDEVHSVTPAELDPDSGWICYVRIGDRELVAFDFRYNRRRASALLERAREFLLVTQGGAAEHPAVAVDCAFSAAELSVQAQMMLHQISTRSHQDP